MYYDAKKKLWRETVSINGQKKVFSGKTKQDALLKIVRFKDEAKKSILFDSVAEQWYEEKWEKLRFGSWSSYNACYRRILEQFGERSIEEIKPKDVQAYLNHLGEDFAMKTVANHKTVLTQIFDYAIVEIGMDMYNPCDRVKLPQGLRKSKRNNLTTEEVKVIQSGNLTDFQLAYLILYTGCRCGEAIALQMKDVDMKKDVIHITKSIRHHGNQPVMQQTKTVNSIRTIPLLKPLKLRLKQLNLSQEEFIVSGEKPLTKSALDKRWKKWCRDNGISIDRHTIRHQYATILYESGVDAKTAQELLGHAQIATTMDIYTHLSESQKQKARIQLETYLANA